MNETKRKEKMRMKWMEYGNSTICHGKWIEDRIVYIVREKIAPTVGFEEEKMYHVVCVCVQSSTEWYRGWKRTENNVEKIVLAQKMR